MEASLALLLPIAFALVGAFAIFALFALQRRAKRSRRLALPLIAILSALVFSLLAFTCGEFYYRFLYEGTDSFAVTTTQQEWNTRYWRVNNWGLRDNVDYAPVPPVGKVRVTFLGDSSLAGAGVADVAARYANRIRATHNDRWDVHVLGVPASSTGNELALLAKLFQERQYQTDLVVLDYDCNDIEDLSADFKNWAGERLQTIERMRNNFLVRHSRFLEIVLTRNLFSALFNVDDYNRVIEGAYGGADWSQQEYRLDLPRRLCASHGATFVIVSGCRYIERYGRSANVPLLNPWDFSKDYDEATLIVSPSDRHPSAFAHGLLAETIGRFIEPYAVQGPRTPVEAELSTVLEYLKAHSAEQGS
ncbi:MAG: SGNH/GDSL hydrolase family protein [Pirellulales bacterium]|nr:SGNH/GDSL hydrolase family protein [Pirellulales bacterium]